MPTSDLKTIMISTTHLTVELKEVRLVIECAKCGCTLAVAEPEKGLLESGSHVRCANCDEVLIDVNSQGKDILHAYRRLRQAADALSPSVKLGIRVPLQSTR
jgi:phage FluMu protein Com